MEKQDRRKFIKIAGKALLVTSGVTVFGLTSAKPKVESWESQDEYYSDGYYDDGYYDDGYTTGLGRGNDGMENLSLMALPNPSNGNFELVISAKSFESSKILINDLSGKMIMQKSCILNPGENRFSFESDSFARGIYELTVMGEKSRGTLRIIIAK